MGVLLTSRVSRPDAKFRTAGADEPRHGRGRLTARGIDRTATLAFSLYIMYIIVLMLV